MMLVVPLLGLMITKSTHLRLRWYIQRGSLVLWVWGRGDTGPQRKGVLLSNKLYAVQPLVNQTLVVEYAGIRRDSIFKIKDRSYTISLGGHVIVVLSVSSMAGYTNHSCSPDVRNGGRPATCALVFLQFKTWSLRSRSLLTTDGCLVTVTTHCVTLLKRAVSWNI